MGFSSPPRVFGSQNLTTVKLKGVGESFKKYPDYESKGIKAHFNLEQEIPGERKEAGRKGERGQSGNRVFSTSSLISDFGGQWLHSSLIGFAFSWGPLSQGQP